MLPYTPLHHLLARELGIPFVLTSGTAATSRSPIATTTVRERLASLCDFRLVPRPPDPHALRRLGRARARGRVRMLRRARGFAPRPLALPFAAPRPILACGGELKSTICLAQGRARVRLAPPRRPRALRRVRVVPRGDRPLRAAVRRAPRARRARPAPGVPVDEVRDRARRARTRLALEGVQHHHAHAAACLAEAGHDGRAIAVCFDGLGYGSDGTLWGGELLIADCAEFERAGALAPVAMPGGTAAIREPWRMALAHLDAAYGDAIPTGSR
jgi:hydrogenase maturation protein HypF